VTAPPSNRPSGTAHAEAVADFLRGVRGGIESGLDPLSAAQDAAEALPAGLRETLQAIARRLRGEYAEDEWGFDEQFAEALFGLFELLYRVWWRVEAVGVRRVPSHGRALLVANHAGSPLPFDAAMITVALMKEHPLPRWPRFEVDDWAFALPFASAFFRRLGGVPGRPDNTARALGSDELLISFPEGPQGPRKPFAERYRLAPFGRGEFVELALATGAPIVPVAVVGSEEIYPKLGESRTLGRAVGAPFLPITPTFPWLGPLGLIPLPSRWRIEFCEPLDLSGHSPADAGDRRVVFDLSERVRETIQERLYENLLRRGSAFT
jgi:1-acyl-sn-glycerol-3-phosphate acyltransferase